MSTRVFLAARSLVRVPTRGKALENWARPSIDELGVPAESWSIVNSKLQARYNIHLAAGLLVLGGTLVFCSNVVDLNMTPKHLMK